MLHPQIHLAHCVLPHGGDAFHQRDHPRPDDLRRLQVLAPQAEQHARRVVLDRPREQELLRVLPFRPACGAPAQPGRDRPQMLGAGLLPRPVPGQIGDRHPELHRDPVRRGRRHRGDLVRHETQPRQRTQLDRQPEPVPRPARRALQPGPIIRAKREIPDQLVATQLLRPRPQPLDFRIREEPRGHPDTARPRTIIREPHPHEGVPAASAGSRLPLGAVHRSDEALTSTSTAKRCFFGACYRRAYSAAGAGPVTSPDPAHAAGPRALGAGGLLLVVGGLAGLSLPLRRRRRRDRPRRAGPGRRPARAATPGPPAWPR